MASRTGRGERGTSRVFVHVGAPTTGATFLRETLARHRRRLARVGVLYPPSHFGHEGGHVDAVLDVLELSTAGHAPSTGAWERLAETVRDWRRGTAVISHELLADASTQQVRRIVDSFGGVETHVVYAVGDLVRQVPLAWQEWVRSGGTAPFTSYVDRVAARDEHRVSRIFWQSHDLGEVLGRWAAVVPPERIHVVTVPDGGDREVLHGDVLLWDRFARTVGIDPRRFGATPGRHRRLLGLAENEVLRLLNVDTAQQADPARLARVRRALEPGAGPAPAVPRVHGDRLRLESHRLVGAVETGGYDVVGDLADLIPGPEAFATDDREVTPAAEDVIRVQTRVVATLAGLHRRDEGPAGFRQRALREISRRSGFALRPGLSRRSRSSGPRR